MKAVKLILAKTGNGGDLAVKMDAFGAGYYSRANSSIFRDSPATRFVPLSSVM